MTQYINVKTWPWLAFALSSALLLGALGFEHIGGMPPCQMCYWQRHAHKAVLVVSGLALLNRYYSRNAQFDKIFIYLIAATFMVSFGLAFWHTGVEYKWWEGPKTCAATAASSSVGASDIIKMLEGKSKVPSCTDAPWHLFKISMAGYNAILSAIGMVLGLSIKEKSP